MPLVFIDTICDYSYIATTCVINHLLNIFQWVLVPNREGYHINKNVGHIYSVCLCCQIPRNSFWSADVKFNVGGALLSLLWGQSLANYSNSCANISHRGSKFNSSATASLLVNSKTFRKKSCKRYFNILHKKGQTLGSADVFCVSSNSEQN